MLVSFCILIVCISFFLQADYRTPIYSRPSYGSGLRIEAAGIGFGVSERVDTWTQLKPNSLEGYVSQMMRAGIGKVRHVFGWPIIVKDKPGYVALLHNDPGRGQDAVTKGQVGNITPLGGKVDLDKLSGFHSLSKAYVAGGMMELDEHNGPSKRVLEMFNKLQGLESKVLSSKDAQTLYIRGIPVLTYQKKQDGVEYDVKLTAEGKNPANFAALENLVVTYAIGLNPVDRVSKGPHKGKPIATAVVNVWPVEVWEFIKRLPLGAEAKSNGARGIKAIPIRQLGARYRTTVSNLVALALLGSNSRLYKQLTGHDMPEQMPLPSEIEAMKESLYASGYSIDDVVRMFNEKYPPTPKKEKKEGTNKNSASSRKGSCKETNANKSNSKNSAKSGTSSKASKGSSSSKSASSSGSSVTK